MAALWTAWQARGAVDAAWVGDGQQKAVAAALAAMDPETVRPDALRIAVLHHQLFPAGPIAEIKAFETMINLGEFLDWIADTRIDVALHGHKHSARLAPYEHTAFHKSDTSDGYRTLVISAPTARAGYEANASIARLLTIEPPQPRAGGVVVRDIPAIESGGQLDIWQRPKNRFRLDLAVTRGQILGDDVDDVHQKLIALRDDYSTLPLPLVCRIRRGESAAAMPTGYPDIPLGVPDAGEWFAQTVAWWQNQRAGRAAQFNHGQRLQSFGAGRLPLTRKGLNQVEQAVQALKHKEVSSRAIAVLVDPDTDLSDLSSKFPAFILVQFTIEAGLLNVIAYFRKQEMPHWWPINVAELSRLQAEVIHRLTGTRLLSPGSITTITAQPVAGSAVPRVAIPSLDSRADASNGMLELVLPLFHSTAAGPEEARAAWRQAFDDWAPTASVAADGDPMPVLGLEELAVALESAAEIYGSSPQVSDIADQLKLITAACQQFTSDPDSSGPTARAAWVEHVSKRRGLLIELVDRRIADVNGIPAATE